MKTNVDTGDLVRMVANPSSKIRRLALPSELQAILALCWLLTPETGVLPSLDRIHLREQLREILEPLSDRLFVSCLRED